MDEDRKEETPGTPRWQAPDRQKQIDADAYHIWTPRPLLRSVYWKPEPEPAREAVEASYEVFLDQRAFLSMHRHVWGGQDGGAAFGYLIGDLCEDPGENRRFVIVTAVLPSRFPYSEDEGISDEAALVLRLEVERRRGVLVGWYHAHAAGPVELSAADVAQHEQRFSDPWQVAVLFVTDPEAPAGGCFRRTTSGLDGSRPLPFYEMATNESLLAKGVRRSRLDWSNVRTGDRIRPEPPDRPGTPPAIGSWEDSADRPPAADSAGRDESDEPVGEAADGRKGGLLSLSRFDDDASLLESEVEGRPDEEGLPESAGGETALAGMVPGAEEVDFDALVAEVLREAGEGTPATSTEPEPEAGERDDPAVVEAGTGEDARTADPGARKPPEETPEPRDETPEPLQASPGLVEEDAVEPVGDAPGPVSLSTEPAAEGGTNPAAPGRRTVAAAAGIRSTERWLRGTVLAIAGLLLLAALAFAILRFAGTERSAPDVERQVPAAAVPEAAGAGTTGPEEPGIDPAAGDTSAAPAPAKEIGEAELVLLSEQTMAAISRFYGRDVARERGEVSCPELQAAFLEVMDAWIEYSGRGKAAWSGQLPESLARRDVRLYRGVQDVERLFGASGCPRP